LSHNIVAAVCACKPSDATDARSFKIEKADAKD